MAPIVTHRLEVLGELGANGAERPELDLLDAANPHTTHSSGTKPIPDATSQGIFIDRRPRVVKYHRPSSMFPRNRLHPLSAPDVLDDAVPLGEAVHGVVGLAHGADEAAEGVGVVLAGDGAAVLVDFGDVDLDGAVVLGLDDAVGGAALAGDVTVVRG